MPSNKGRRYSLILAASLILSGALAWAQQYPDKAITLIVPYAAGGPTDVVLRTIAEEARKTLGQSIVVENRPGANGTFGALALARAPADGYTLAILPATVYREPHIHKVSYDPLTSFSYILLMTDYTFGFVVNSDAPWRNWAAFAAEAAKRPGQLNVGAGGGPTGSPSLAIQEAAEAAKIKINLVAYKGDADVATAILGGHIDAAALSGVAVPQIEAGKMRYLALLTEERIKRYPDIATLKEQGVNVWVDSAYGLAGPKGMDPARVKVIHDAFKKAIESPAGQKMLDQLNQETNYKGPEDYRRYAEAAYEREKVRVAKLRERGLLN